MIELAEILVEKGNPNSISDAGVAAELALAGVKGACMNVLINLSNVNNVAYCDDKRKSVKSLVSKANILVQAIYEKTIDKIES